MSTKTESSEIVANSLFLAKWMNQPSRGRRQIISGEASDYGKDTAMSLTFEDKSLFILLPTYLPEIYTYSDDENDKRMIKGIIKYITQTCKAVEGFNDTTLSSEGPSFKSEFFNMPMFTNVTGATKEITLTVPAELSGYVITNGLNHWVNAISDEHSRVAGYNNTGLEFNNWSHSCGMIYIKPNKTFTRVGFGALFFTMVPINVPKSSFNADATAPGVIELNLQFTVNVIDTRNILVREMCESVLHKYKEHIVYNSSLYGSHKNTSLELGDDFDADSIIDGM